MKEQPVRSRGNRQMKTALNKRQVGTWALVTGASSGIGKEFARQIAAAGINVVLLARREALLEEVGRDIASDFKVDYRALAVDLSQEGFLARLAQATNDLDIGLVVSNAGTGNPGEFLKLIGNCFRRLCASTRWHTWTSLTISARNSPSAVGAALSSFPPSARTLTFRSTP